MFRTVYRDLSTPEARLAWRNSPEKKRIKKEREEREAARSAASCELRSIASAPQTPEKPKRSGAEKAARGSSSCRLLGEQHGQEPVAP